MPARTFRELRVYQLAFETAAKIQQVTETFPAEERFSLIDQIRRSSRSVCANVGEAWRKRRYPNSFVSKLSDADAEATETQVWLDFALRFGYINHEMHVNLSDACDHVCAQLNLMMEHPDKWATTKSS